MKVIMIGAGYVGLVSGLALLNLVLMSHVLMFFMRKIDSLNNGEIPIYEPGLDHLVKKNIDLED